MERQHWLNNMSAPPRSQITIAPHRSSRKRALVYIPNFPTELEDWQQYILDWTYMRTWEDLKDSIREVEPTIPNICVVGAPLPSCQITVAPITTIALLSRIIGNLYLKRTDAFLHYDRLCRRVCIADDKILRRLTTNPLSSERFR